MKSTLILIVVFGCCYAAPYGGGYVNTGHSAQYRSDNSHGYYEFGYNEDHATGGTFRKEKGGPGYKEGSYGLRDADGRLRIVHYIADAHGFRATVTTNEPGVDVSQDPAATSFSGNAYSAPAHAIAPVPNLYSDPDHSVASPVTVAKLYSQPLNHHVAHNPIQHDPLYAHASSPSLHSTNVYEPAESHYSPALSDQLMSHVYDAPIHKSIYTPDYSANNGEFGMRLIPVNHYSATGAGVGGYY